MHVVLGQVGWSESPVLIQGERGSGKEMIARELHAGSPRAGMPFRTFDCAAPSPQPAESLFSGHVAGGGAIFLDEVGVMDPRLQAKVLQALSDGVRIFAATSRDLESAVKQGSFREDLYYRLNVVTLHLPPLRERKGDIAGLAGFLLKMWARPGDPIPAITPELEAAMLAWSWPENFRELQIFARKLSISRDPAAAARELRDLTARRPAISGAALPVPSTALHIDYTALLRTGAAGQPLRFTSSCRKHATA